ncbi:MAG: dihydrodipicolinate synthase family protein [Hyphomicrobiaceae bacterium]
MAEAGQLHGVIAPVLTPFGEDGAPDQDRFIEHCEWLLAEGCTALAPFGTTSEAPSLGLDERMELLDALVEAGIDPSRLMPGTGAPSLMDAIVLTEHAVDVGCAGVLVLPPYYFKQPSEEGIYRYYAELIEEVGDHRMRLYLYHIPQLTGVPLKPDLVARLASDYPEVVVGLKDSSGNMAGTLELLARFPDLAIFPGSEALLLEGLRHGAAGCISASANVAARQIRALYDRYEAPEADELHAQVSRVRRAFENVPLIPGLKALVAHYRNDPQWRVLRPPLVELELDEQRALVAALDRDCDFRLVFPGV